MRSRNMASATSTCRRRQIESGVSLVPMRRLGADCFVVVRHRLCRPTANETLVSHCRVVGIELRGRDCFFVAFKRGNARGAKGAGHRHLARVNRQREEPDVQWKAAAFATNLARAFLVGSISVSGPSGGGADGLLSATTRVVQCNKLHDRRWRNSLDHLVSAA